MVRRLRMKRRWINEEEEQPAYRLPQKHAIFSFSPGCRLTMVIATYRWLTLLGVWSVMIATGIILALHIKPTARQENRAIQQVSMFWSDFGRRRVSVHAFARNFNTAEGVLAGALAECNGLCCTAVVRCTYYFHSLVGWKVILEFISWCYV